MNPCPIGSCSTQALPFADEEPFPRTGTYDKNPVACGQPKRRGGRAAVRDSCRDASEANRLFCLPAGNAIPSRPLTSSWGDG